jgi:hypothetical protein
MVRTPEVEQLPPGFVVEFRDRAPQNDSMVAAIIGEEFLAFKNGECAGQKWDGGFHISFNAAPSVAGWTWKNAPTNHHSLRAH